MGNRATLDAEAPWLSLIPLPCGGSCAAWFPKSDGAGPVLKFNGGGCVAGLADEDANKELTNEAAWVTGGWAGVATSLLLAGMLGLKNKELDALEAGLASVFCVNREEATGKWCCCVEG